MLSIDTHNHFAFASLRSERIVSGSSTFMVPNSPLRADGSAAFGRNVGKGTLASEASPVPSFEPASPVYAAMYGQPMMGLEQEADRTRSRLGASGVDAGDEDGAAGDAARNPDSNEEGDGGNAGGKKLDEAEQRQVDELKQRDQEVRRHEQAHKAVGGQYAGAMSFEFQQGPDGQRYAVGGEVSIDISAEKDPAATIKKMQQVRAAALAPAEPSGQDQSVAAQASTMEAEARQELNRQRTEETQDGDTTEGAGNAEGAEKSENGKDGVTSGGTADSASPASQAAGASQAAQVSPAASLTYHNAGISAPPYASYANMPPAASRRPIDTFA